MIMIIIVTVNVFKPYIQHTHIATTAAAASASVGACTHAGPSLRFL